MYKTRDKNNYTKKMQPTLQTQSSFTSKMQTISANCLRNYDTESPYHIKTQQKTIQSVESSRIADQRETIQHNYHSFQDAILKKVENIEEQSSKLVEKKERQMYFLKINLQNCQSHLKQAELQLKYKDETINRLEIQLSRIKGKEFNYRGTSQNRDIRQLQEQNEKLKESLRILIQDKNENWKNISKPEKQTGFTYDRLNVQTLKKEVEQLRIMISQMQKTVNNCPSCFSLKRQNEQLATAYGCLIKQHTQLTKSKQNHEKQFLHTISTKIQDNQNILRQNIRLKQDRNGRPFQRNKPQRLKESVAKRCRTLTDQF